MPPNRISTPGVIGVRPDQEVEALLGKLEVGAQVMDRSLTGLAIGQHLRVDRQLHHNRLAIEPGSLQAFKSGAWIGDGLRVDGNPGTPVPGLWRAHSRQHDNASAKFRRPWHGHRSKLPEGCFTTERIDFSRVLRGTSRVAAEKKEVESSGARVTRFARELRG